MIILLGFFVVSILDRLEKYGMLSVLVVFCFWGLGLMIVINMVWFNCVMVFVWCRLISLIFVIVRCVCCVVLLFNLWIVLVFINFFLIIIIFVELFVFD